MQRMPDQRLQAIVGLSHVSGLVYNHTRNCASGKNIRFTSGGESRRCPDPVQRANPGYRQWAAWATQSGMRAGFHQKLTGVTVSANSQRCCRLTRAAHRTGVAKDRRLRIAPSVVPILNDLGACSNSQDLTSLISGKANKDQR